MTTTTDKPHWHSDILKSQDGISSIYRWKGNINGHPTVVEIFDLVKNAWLPCKNLEISKIIAEKTK